MRVHGVYPHPLRTPIQPQFKSQPIPANFFSPARGGMGSTRCGTPSSRNRRVARTTPIGAINIALVPLCPARPARPARCVYASGFVDSSPCTTRVTPLDVDPARRNVRGDQHPQSPAAKRRERAVARSLLHLPRQRAHCKPGHDQLVRDMRRVRARAHEHQRLIVRMGQQQVDQRIQPLRRVDHVDHVLDVHVCRTETRPFHVCGLALQPIRQ